MEKVEEEEAWLSLVLHDLPLLRLDPLLALVRPPPPPPLVHWATHGGPALRTPASRSGPRVRPSRAMPGRPGGS